MPFRTPSPHDEEAAGRSALSAAVDRVEPQQEVGAKKIIIAEDDDALAQVLARRCRALGFRVQTTADALTALNLIALESPDLVCLDVGLTGGNGLSVCEMLATNPQLVGIPVVVLTGRTDEETMRRCYDLCAYYVPKCSDVWRRLEPLISELLDINRVGETPHLDNRS